MTPTTDALLAQLSLDAYSDTPVALPSGVFAFGPTTLGVPLAPGETFSDGIFHSGNGAALVTETTIDGQPTIVVAFRGSDDSTDSQEDLNNINQAYGDFSTLLAAVDVAAKTWGNQVVVTGHSLGGAMAQLYMASHPDVAGGPTHQAATFGSPGAILPAGTDARITNFAIADDPAVVLGAHRAEIGALLQADPTIASAAADQAVLDFPGLTKAQALAALVNLTVNYDNHGQTILLPSHDGTLAPAADLSNLSALNASEHSPELYASDLATWAAGTLPWVAVPETATTDPQLAEFQAIYDGAPPDPTASKSVIDGLFQDFVTNHLGSLPADITSTITQVQTGATTAAQDLNLI